MLKKVLPLILALSWNLAIAQPLPALIPQPVSIQTGQGEFLITAKTPIQVYPAALYPIAEELAATIKRSTGYSLKIIKGQTNMVISSRILITMGPEKNIPADGYTLTVTRNNLVLRGTTEAGVFHGMQTILQLLPKEIELARMANNVHWKIPAVNIIDYPRFGWRGLMLDVSRHFFTVAEVKGFIDQMAKYKFNRLHWHLTDDQGWRVEIKSLPRLTEVGAWRVNKTGKFNTFSPPLPDEPLDYGGFYTQEQIKDVVAYAKSKHIEILPEIDVPGHSLAAIAAYPELTCTDAPAGKYRVNSGEPFMIWPPGGHFYGLVDNSLCPANEKVYEFMDKVFTELAQLFPFEYIHMGGDETARNFWEKSEKIKELMKRENLKDLDEVQAYFVGRMQKIIQSKGKKMIGWDEILQGGLVPGATVMSWRGMKGGIEAAKLGHEVVMSPTDFVYIDYMQGDAAIEPPVYASLRLNKTYQFEPVPDGVDAKLIKGGQANLWTEQVYNTRHMQYMVWPRAFAVAEALWSPKEARDWKKFVPRVEQHFKRFDEANINYSPAMYDPVVKASKKDTATIVLNFDLEIDGLKAHYSFDNSFPDEFYPSASGPVTVPKDASTLKVITSRNGKLIGRMIVIPVSELKKRSGIK